MLNLDCTFLPVGRMRQISRVTEIEGPRIAAEMKLGPDHWVYPDHFPGDPVFPGCLMIEGAGQLVALWAWADGARGHPRLVKSEARFHQPVTPDRLAISLRADVTRRRELYLGAVDLFVAADTRVASVSIVLSIQADESD